MKTSLTHFFNKNWFELCISLVIVVAVITRFYGLAQVPSGMTWDEAAIGYNGNGIWMTRRDEWLRKLPITFQSFGDYKAPLAIYINGFFTVLFGLNLWAVRFPFALSGVMAIIGMMGIVHEVVALTVKKKQLLHKELLIIAVGAWMIISPWHFHFSRAGFESGMALAFIIWGVWLLLVHVRAELIWLKRITFVLSPLLFAASMYTYHSAKIVAPVLLLLLIVFLFFKKLLGLIPALGVSLLFSLGISVLLYSTILGKSSERFSQVSVLTQEISFSEKLTVIAGNATAHLMPSYLYFGETTTFRHGDGRWGVLFLFDAIFLIGGLVTFLKWRRLNETDRWLLLFAVSALLVGTIPASISVAGETPHANRALLSLPGYLLLIAIGWKQVIALDFSKIFSTKTDGENIRKIVVGMSILIYVLSFVSYSQDYFTRFKSDSVKDFFYGYEQVVDYSVAHEDEVENIIMTNSYGQPYIYVLFFRETNPLDFHRGSLVKYLFVDKVSIGDFERPNALLIATPEEIDPSLADDLVIAPNGEIRFVMVKTRKNP